MATLSAAGFVGYAIFIQGLRWRREGREGYACDDNVYDRSPSGADNVLERL